VNLLDGIDDTALTLWFAAIVAIYLLFLKKA
jgi:hypothetical protein